MLTSGASCSHAVGGPLPAAEGITVPGHLASQQEMTVQQRSVHCLHDLSSYEVRTMWSRR